MAKTGATEKYLTRKVNEAKSGTTVIVTSQNRLAGVASTNLQGGAGFDVASRDFSKERTTFRSLEREDRKSRRNLTVEMTMEA